MLKTIQTVVGDIQSITLKNTYLEVEILSYGASLFHLWVMDGDQKREVSVQPDDIDEFLTSDFYYGKTVGRTAGRIFHPSYTIDDTEYLLDERSYPSLLHGGEQGFSFKHFDFVEASHDMVKLKAISYADEGPYDGILTLFATYQIKDQSLQISYEAHTTETTLCNITNHVYLNLSKTSSIQDHVVHIYAHSYLNIDDQNKILSIEDVKAPFDFNQGLYFKDALQLMEHTPFHGFDHTFIFDEKTPTQMKVSVENIDMELKTSYPSVVLYTHNKPAPHRLRGLDTNNNQHVAFTIETQYEPGGIQFKGLNQAILEPHQQYFETTTLTFNVKKTK